MITVKKCSRHAVKYFASKHAFPYFRDQISQFFWFRENNSILNDTSNKTFVEWPKGSRAVRLFLNFDPHKSNEFWLERIVHLERKGKNCFFFILGKVSLTIQRLTEGRKILAHFNTGSNDVDVTVSKLCISESKVSCEHCVTSPSARDSFECSRVHSAAKNWELNRPRETRFCSESL